MQNASEGKFPKPKREWHLTQFEICTFYGGQTFQIYPLFVGKRAQNLKAEHAIHFCLFYNAGERRILHRK